MERRNMGHRVLWTLIGPADRVLDSGDLEEFGDATSPSDAVATHLSDFAQAGRDADRG